MSHPNLRINVNQRVGSALGSAAGLVRKLILQRVVPLDRDGFRTRHEGKARLTGREWPRCQHFRHMDLVAQLIHQQVGLKNAIHLHHKCPNETQTKNEQNHTKPVVSHSGPVARSIGLQNSFFNQPRKGVCCAPLDATLGCVVTDA